MKRIMIIGCLFLILIASCKKDHNPIDEPVTDSVLDYMPLAIGNYWIYETFSCDYGGTNCISLSIDTTRVTKDTVINGNEYYALEGNFFLFTDAVFIRDSGDYLVNHIGQTIFTFTDSANIFNEQVVLGQANDTIYHWFTKLYKPAGQISVGAGSYDCLDFRTLFFRLQDSLQTPLLAHQYYAKNVGLIKQTTFFAVSLREYRRELIGYSFVNR